MSHQSTRGWKAFVAHRISGLLILGYLYLHLILLSSILLPNGAAHFNAVARIVEQPVFIGADLVLLGIILVHGLNGIRLMVADFGGFIRNSRLAIWLTMITAALILGMGFLVLLANLVR